MGPRLKAEDDGLIRLLGQSPALDGILSINTAVSHAWTDTMFDCALSTN
jgi:hypothetical protein